MIAAEDIKADLLVGTAMKLVRENAKVGAAKAKKTTKKAATAAEGEEKKPAAKKSTAKKAAPAAEGEEKKPAAKKTTKKAAEKAE